MSESIQGRLIDFIIILLLLLFFSPLVVKIAPGVKNKDKMIN